MVSQTDSAMETYGANSPDLSDLRERINWCFHNRRHCESIAAAGQQLGQQIIEDLNQDLCTATVRYAQHWMKG